MRRFIVFVAAAVLFSSAALAQVSSKDFNDRYQLLVSKLGPSGVGIETLINRWETAYPDDIEMLIAKFSFISRSRRVLLWWSRIRISILVRSRFFR